MFVRDPWDTETGQQAGPWTALGDVPPAEDQAALRTLHGLALAIYQAQQDVLAAQRRNDVAYVRQRVQDVARLRDLFRQKAAAFETADASLMGSLEGFMAGVATWVDQAIAAIPGAIQAIPNAVIEGVAGIGRKIATEGLKLSLPLFLLGGGLLFFLRQAERSRIVRRVVR